MKTTFIKNIIKLKNHAQFILFLSISNICLGQFGNPTDISKSVSGDAVGIGYGADHIIHQPGESDILKISETKLLATWGCQFLHYSAAKNPNSYEPDHSETRLMGKIGTYNYNNGTPKYDWTHSFRLFNWMPWEKDCPFEKFGTMCYYRPYYSGQQLIFFSENGKQYSVFTDNGSYSWTSSYNINQMGDGNCPFNSAGIGAAMYYRPIGTNGTQLIFFDKSGFNYVVYSEYIPGTPMWQGSFTLSQFAGGTMPSGLLNSGIGACTFYRQLNGGRQYILFNMSGDNYWIYSENCPGVATWQGGNTGFSVNTDLGSAVSGQKSPFPQIGAAFHYSNDDLIFYDIEREQYIKWNASTNYWEDFDNIVDQSPNLVLNQGNNIGVYYLKKEHIDINGKENVVTDIYYNESSNNGYTFGNEGNITDHILSVNLNENYYFVLENCRFLKLSNGDKLLPIQLYQRFDINGDPQGHYPSVCYRLPNGLSNFTSGTSNWIVDRTNVNFYNSSGQAQEPGVIQYHDTVLMFNRPIDNNYIFMTSSTDNAQTWGNATNGTQWNTTMNCGVTAPNNMKTYFNSTTNTTDIINIWCNDNTGWRKKFSSSVSSDGGRNWATAKLIDPNVNYSFGYPALLFQNSDAYLLYGSKTYNGAGYNSTLIFRFFPISDFY